MCRAVQAVAQDIDVRLEKVEGHAVTCEHRLEAVEDKIGKKHVEYADTLLKQRALIDELKTQMLALGSSPASAGTPSLPSPARSIGGMPFSSARTSDGPIRS